jgi:hypothetical protein
MEKMRIKTKRLSTDKEYSVKYPEMNFDIITGPVRTLLSRFWGKKKYNDVPKSNATDTQRAVQLSEDFRLISPPLREEVTNRSMLYTITKIVINANQYSVMPLIKNSLIIQCVRGAPDC